MIKQETTKKTCEWTYEEDNYYTTSCSEAFFFVSGNWQEHNFKYCPFCGKEINEVKT
jgi:hypothetical protein